MNKFYLVTRLLCLAILGTSISASAGVIGLLSWDESSPYIVDNSSADVSYLQLGLHKSYNYHQILEMTAVGGAWEGYRLASQSDAYAFVQSALFGVSTLPWDNKSSNVSEEWRVSASQPFADGALGNNYDSQRDFFFFESDFQNRLGLVELDSSKQTIMLREANNTYWDSNNYAKTGTSKESAWVSYLLVKHNQPSYPVSPVPESSTFLLVALGLLGISFKSLSKRR